MAVREKEHAALHASHEEALESAQAEHESMMEAHAATLEAREAEANQLTAELETR